MAPPGYGDVLARIALLLNGVDDYLGDNCAAYDGQKQQSVIHSTPPIY